MMFGVSCVWLYPLCRFRDGACQCEGQKTLRAVSSRARSKSVTRTGQARSSQTHLASSRNSKHVRFLRRWLSLFLNECDAVSFLFCEIVKKNNSFEAVSARIFGLDLRSLQSESMRPLRVSYANQCGLTINTENELSPSSSWGQLQVSSHFISRCFKTLYR